MYIKTDPDKGETRPSTIMRYIWDVENVSQWLEPINISHLMNILWKQCWLETCGAVWGLVAHCYSWCQAPGPPWPRLGSSPRDQMLSDQSELSSEQWWQSPGTWSPGHTCKHHTVDSLGKARGKCFARDTRLQYPRVTTGSIVCQQPEWSGASSVTWWLIQWYSSSHVNPLSLDITTQDPGCHTLPGEFIIFINVFPRK